MTKQKPGWKYIYSESLKQEIAVHLKTGWVYCKDGTKYSPLEIEVLINAKQRMPLKVHNIKKILEGRIIKIIKKSAKTKQEQPAKPDTSNKELEIW